MKNLVRLVILLALISLFSPFDGEVSAWNVNRIDNELILEAPANSTDSINEEESTEPSVMTSTVPSMVGAQKTKKTLADYVVLFVAFLGFPVVFGYVYLIKKLDDRLLAAEQRENIPLQVVGPHPISPAPAA